MRGTIIQMKKQKKRGLPAEERRTVWHVSVEKEASGLKKKEILKK